MDFVWHTRIPGSRDHSKQRYVLRITSSGVSHRATLSHCHMLGGVVRSWKKLCLFGFTKKVEDRTCFIFGS